MKKLVALMLTVVMLLSVTLAAVAETSYEAVLNPLAGGDLKETLTNMDLDGTLKPGMYEGKKITVAVSTGDYVDSMNEYAALFKELTGGEVEVQSNPDDLFTKVQLALSTGGLYDVVLMPIAYIHSYAYSEYIADLKPLIDQYAAPGFDQADFIPGLFDTYANYDNKLVALPYKPDTQMFFYRKDLFEDEALKAKFKEMNGTELTVPTTPEEFLKVAQFFTKSINPDSPVDYGFSTMMSKGNSRFDWFNRLGAFGGKELNDDFTLGFTDGSGLKALEFMNELAKCAPADWLSFDWDTANTFFCQGNAAMMEQWPYLGTLVEADGSAVKGKIGAAVCPGASPTLGGWALGIASDCQNQEMAFKFIEMCTSKDGEIMKIRYSMDPCRTSNYSRDVVTKFSDKYQAFMENLAVATQLADTDIPYGSAEIADAEEVAIQAMLSGEKTPEEALNQMADAINAIIESNREDME